MCSFISCKSESSLKISIKTAYLLTAAPCTEAPLQIPSAQYAQQLAAYTCSPAVVAGNCGPPQPLEWLNTIYFCSSSDCVVHWNSNWTFETSSLRVAVLRLAADK